jgi:hypothetical protein
MAEIKKIERLIKSLKLENIPAGNNELILNCPEPSCPNPKKHLYMNKSTGLFICHRCGVAGNIITFLTILKKIDAPHAFRFLKEDAAETPSIESIRSRLNEIYAAANHIFKESGLKNIIVPPKESLEITNFKYPKLLTNRKIPFSLAKKIKVRYCNSGRYNGRVIFPFGCNGHKSFVAYATAKWQSPKTLNPPGSWNKDLLYGYDLLHEPMPKIVKAVPKFDGLVVVEGIFDYLRLTLYGYKCVALMKSFLSKNQAILLNDCNFSKIIFMLDGDVSEEEYPRKLRHRNCIDSKRCFVAKIPNEEQDPDMLSEGEVFELINKAVIESGELTSLKDRIKKVKRMLE